MKANTNALGLVHQIRDHIRSEDYWLTSCTLSEACGVTYLLALKQRYMLPKLIECRNLRDLKCWAVGHLIRSIEH